MNFLKDNKILLFSWRLYGFYAKPEIAWLISLNKCPGKVTKDYFTVSTQGLVITVLPQSSILDSHLTKDETLKFQYARIKNQGSRVKD